MLWQKRREMLSDLSLAPLARAAAGALAAYAVSVAVLASFGRVPVALQLGVAFGVGYAVNYTDLSTTALVGAAVAAVAVPRVVAYATAPAPPPEPRGDAVLVLDCGPADARARARATAAAAGDTRWVSCDANFGVQIKAVRGLRIDRAVGAVVVYEPLRNFAEGNLGMLADQLVEQRVRRRRNRTPFRSEERARRYLRSLSRCGGGAVPIYAICHGTRVLRLRRGSFLAPPVLVDVAEGGAAAPPPARAVLDALVADEIRAAAAGDVAGLRALISANECLKNGDDDALAAIGERYVASVLAGEFRDWDACARVYAGHASQLWVLAAADGRVAGCVGLLDRGGGSFELVRMYVDASKRRSGRGRRLLAAALAHARARGARAVWLTTPSANAAGVAFYEASGFAFDGPPFTPDSVGAPELRRLRLAL